MVGSGVLGMQVAVLDLPRILAGPITSLEPQIPHLQN